ncbi:MAG: putative AlkP superfamily phosphohydrolase/phosphomutase, partial [Candidatus Krumholzibacteriia bacterium]
MKRLLMIIVLVAACAHAAEDTKVLVVGFDGMDPLLLQKFRDEGVMPNFDKFVADGGEMKPLGTSTPPQSPVAWSNFITGRDSGGHGIFDFIHRDPQTLLPYFSASEAKGPTRFWRIGDWKIP